MRCAFYEGSRQFIDKISGIVNVVSENPIRMLEFRLKGKSGIIAL